MRILLLAFLFVSPMLSLAVGNSTRFDENTFRLFKVLRKSKPHSNFAYSPFLLKSALNFIYENSSGDLKSEMSPFKNPVKLPNKDENLSYSFDFIYSDRFTLKDDKIKKHDFNFQKTLMQNPLGVFKLELRSAFESKWKNKFEESLTRKKRFGNDKHGFSEVDFMNGTFGDLVCSGNVSFEYVSLPFENENYEMLFFKPRQNYTLDDFDEKVYSEAMKDLTLPRISVCVSLPKFDISSEIDCISHLKELGIYKLFEFTNDYDLFEEDNKTKIKCENFLSQTKVSISEKGARAISFVSMEFITLGENNEKKEPVYFTLDEPFIYIIIDKKSLEILYIGQIVKFN